MLKTNRTIKVGLYVYVCIVICELCVGLYVFMCAYVCVYVCSMCVNCDIVCVYMDVYMCIYIFMCMYVYVFMCNTGVERVMFFVRFLLTFNLLSQNWLVLPYGLPLG
ncbi:hypothetical protein B484DRAFT_341280 [Ochromonadaceae sp. CCMP2298]|nr:hypothetical protein B484DRAFT_341280 [Ochromonadaceae sp. CCMP2298]